MTVAIYARYSSDLQSERSIDDQIAACEDFARRRGIAGPFLVFADAALSGASMATRPQLQALMRAVRGRQVKAILAEAIDRLSRDQADVHLIRRAATANDVKLYTIADGEVTGMVAGLQGIMAEAFLANLAQKTRRGMMGVAREGRIAGGLSYGYRAIETKPGERSIDESEAATVRRIFAEYGAGISPHAIARKLNAEGVPGPRGRRWKVNAILGDARVGDGVLCNELYRGRVIFNRRRYVKNPETGKRSSFLNPPSEWVIVERPELRIVEEDAWTAVQAVRRTLSKAPTQNDRHRAKRLLSGLLVCAHCSGGFVVRNRGRFACSNVINGSGLCDVRASVPAEILERRVVDGLKGALLAPEIIAEALKGYQEERAAQRKQETRARVDAERSLEEARRRAARVAEQLIENPSPTLKAMLAEADAKIAAAEQTLAAIPPAELVELHPNASKAYAARIAELEMALATDASAEIREAVRGLIDHVSLAPDAAQPDGWSILVHGDLAELLAIGEQKAGRFSLGAGACTGRSPTTMQLVA